MAFLVSQLLFLLVILGGVMVWAFSEVPLAWREIALNTRRSTDQGSPYTMLKVLSVCLKLLAVLLWIAGVAAIVAINVTGSALGGIWPDGPGL